MKEQPQLKAQVQRIRADIERDGESFVGCEELRMLCPEEGSLKTQFEHICDLARQESWSFTFFPSGEVRFAKSSLN